jgi:hypothetical protein
LLALLVKTNVTNITLITHITEVTDPPMKKEVKSAQIPFYKEYDELAEVTCGFG